VQRFLLGVDFMLDGSIVLAPTATNEFWSKGFGQTLRYRGRTLGYRMMTDSVRGTYSGPTAQRLLLKLPSGSPGFRLTTTSDGRSGETVLSARTDPTLPGRQIIDVTLPATREGESCVFRVRREPPAR
jgi:hypothetical protein